MQSPYPFLYPCSYLQDKDEEKQYVGTSTQTSRKIPHLPGEQIRQAGEASTLKHVETSATNICVLVHPLLLQKQTYLISSGSKAKVFHIMLFPYLSLCPCSYLQDKEKESNQSEPEIERPIWNWLPGTFAWLLTEPYSQVLIFKCSDGPCKCKGCAPLLLCKKIEAEGSTTSWNRSLQHDALPAEPHDPDGGT